MDLQAMFLRLLEEAMPQMRSSNQTSSVPEEFKKLQTDAEKIKFCYKELQKSEKLDNENIFDKKNEKMAAELRNKANNLFNKERNFVRALELYNESISLSPPGTQNLGMCYANRSAVFFESGFYQHALDNIKLALENNYPEKMKPKLKKRRVKCLEKLNNATGDEKNDQFSKQQLPFELSYLANKENPSIIDEIELKQSEEFGRYICAKRDLYPGDVVILDKPHYKVLEDDAKHKFCENCFESNFMNLISCKFCTKAMYCGAKCEEEAWKRYHQFECKATESDLNPHLIRTALKIITLFDDLDNLRDLIESVKKNPVTGFDFNLEPEIEHFKAVYCLETNSSKRSIHHYYVISKALARSWHLLVTHSPLKTILKTSDDEDLFLNILFHMFHVLGMNSHSSVFMTKIGKKSGFFDFDAETCGNALMPIMSLLNHSCAPNIYRVNRYGTFAVVVSRNIKAGEQIFDCYGPHHQSHIKYERNQKLSRFFFTCNCEACAKDYPLLDFCRPKFLSNSVTLSDAAYSVTNYDLKWIQEHYKKVKDFLKKFSSQHYLSADVLMVRTRLNCCLDYLYGNVPLELQLKPN
ncbi:SET and MYND domain-containing protein 4-like [Culicoides brevitarsis]|uniref:SET and MYND domain-containing protein 4-like n=1 Tax=Culicoides brevitarsis TaxID=469753 RepID=UPI00307B2EB8